jgi:hypothetical protein
MNIRRAAIIMAAGLLAYGISAPSEAASLQQSGYPTINITPRIFRGAGCRANSFCANLGPPFGSSNENDTIGGMPQGLAYLLELNAFTWYVPRHK